MSLSVFNIKKPVENGKVIEPRRAWTPGVVSSVSLPESSRRRTLLTSLCAQSHPEPWRCSITPRSAKAEALILSEDLNVEGHA